MSKYYVHEYIVDFFVPIIYFVDFGNEVQIIEEDIPIMQHISIIYCFHSQIQENSLVISTNRFTHFN